MNNPNVIALGFFDGVHLGHAALLRQAKDRAQALGVSALAITFDTHPQTLLRGTPVPLLTDCRERERLMRICCHMDKVIPLPFDREMMSMPWEDFLRSVLLEQLHAAWLVCGEDFRFGYRGEGNALLLAEACRKLGIGCDIIPKIELDGAPVSSTAIRRALAEGNAACARRLLGRPYRLTGTVIHGAALGRTLGFPTANLQVGAARVLPRNGVYITRAVTAAGTFPAVTNIGCRPTVDGQTRTVEAWLLDYEGDLYGEEISLDFYDFLREERKFDNLFALQEEIMDNARQTRAYFAALPETESEELL